MLERPRLKLSYANVMATLAMFAVRGGGAYAAATIGAGDIKKNAVRSKHIKKNAVKTPKIKNGAVTANKLGPVTVQRESFDVPDGVNASDTASCPAGQRAIGGGVHLSTGLDDGVVTQSRPVASSSDPPTALLDDGDTFDGWQASALNRGGEDNVFEANVWVVCVR